jgi:hypothetical protein
MSKRRDGAHQMRVRGCNDEAANQQASGEDAAVMAFGVGVVDRSSRRGGRA